MAEENGDNNILELAAELTAAWLSNPNTTISADELPSVIQKIHGALAGISSPAADVASEPVTEYTPAVSVRRSLASKDRIISLIDGKPYAMLKRHLAGHGLTPDQYRERYRLKADYPMVAETYAAKRRELAKKIGLGRKPGAKAAAKIQTPAPVAAAATPKAEKPKAAATKTTAPKTVALKTAAPDTAASKAATPKKTNAAAAPKATKGRTAAKAPKKRAAATT